MLRITFVRFPYRPDSFSCSFPAPECETASLQSSFQDEWVGNFVLRILYSINYRRV